MAVNAASAPAVRPGLRLRTLVPRPVPWMSVLMTLAVVAGLGAMLGSTPIVARGDYGQWLMSSHYYLGEPVPPYRTITALPPFVPVAMAMVQWVVHDPVAALQVVNVGLMAGLAASLFAVGAVVGRSLLAGMLSVTVGLLITDRYMELFAFGGLLQSASVMWTALAAAAFTRAGRGPDLGRRWWVAGSVALALAALSHVGAGTVAVPLCLALAAISLLRLRGLGWRTLRQALVPVFVGLALVGVYWLVVLLPASRDYVTNPASLGYRGPDRLFSVLFEFWPTAMVIVVGAMALVLGSAAELLRRSAPRYVVLATWAAVAWGSLGFAVLTGASTDYPRFAPVLMAPLVPACALAAVAVMRSVSVYLHRQAPRVRPTTWLMVSAATVVMVAAPFATDRYQRQVLTYQPLDAASLVDSVSWLDDVLPRPDLAVLTAVRDGKWLEGATGREALFSLPVRYAFRPSEWQRSVDAQTLLRSTAALTNQFFFAKFTDSATGPGGAVPTGLLLGVNHGGEYVDVLRVARTDTRITSPEGTVTAANMKPAGVERTRADAEVAIRTDWSGQLGSAPVSLTEVLSLVNEGATLHLVEIASTGAVQTSLSAPSGMAVTFLDIVGREASICFTQVGGSEPCVRVVAAQADATLEASEGGGIRIRTAGSRLELLVTAMTAGGASVGLGLLDPAQLVFEHNVGAALLVATDPAYTFRRYRLEALGFRELHRAGPYAILVRGDLVTGVPAR